LENQFQCLYNFYFYLYNCAKNKRILKASLNILTFVSSTRKWKLKIYESLWRRCNKKLQRWKEKACDALPSSLIDSNVSLKWKWWKDKKLKHVHWLAALWG
jgi:hypothetical protein